MTEAVKESIRLNDILKERYSDDDGKRLNGLYLKVFDTDDGKLVLQDIANRCWVYQSAIEEVRPETTEGARSVFLSIQTRLKNALTAGKESK